VSLGELLWVAAAVLAVGAITVGGWWLILGGIQMMRDDARRAEEDSTHD
jgi:hypothetical protein